MLLLQRLFTVWSYVCHIRLRLHLHEISNSNTGDFYIHSYISSSILYIPVALDFANINVINSQQNEIDIAVNPI